MSLGLSFVLTLFLALGLLVGAAGSEPPMTEQETNLYRHWTQEYLLLYDPWRNGVNRIPYYKHLIVSHPNLQQQALEYALFQGNGPYAVEHRRGVSYAMTLIPGNRGPGLRWNLQQNGLPPKDASALWRIDSRGPQLLRLDVWPAGAQAPQLTSMQEVINRFRRRARCCW